MEPNSFLFNKAKINYQTPIAEIISQTVIMKQGTIADNGALCVNTGKFTGRSPENKYFVEDEITRNTIDWGGFNHPIAEGTFLQLRTKIIKHLDSQKQIWCRDIKACADQKYQIAIRIYTELPWVDLFVHNMFISSASEASVEPEWTILQAPNFEAVPLIDGVNAKNFAIISFQHKEIIIGGTGYTGEIKKGVFSILNFLLPHFHNVLSMHCSANMGIQGDVALFFGLSGTGKTTLSADGHRKLIGDDEHGWAEASIFNFEGGCYAKTIKLKAANEPEIFNAIKKGALLENVQFYPDTNTVNYDDGTITENTRVSYPISFIENSVHPSIGPIPKYIFFLTCDAYGVLPPISKLNKEQAMYQFISGYTAKIAGTEEGIKTPKATFSACFGAPFLPLHPGIYAQILGEKLSKSNCEVWLINTGWTGGAYGIGNRIAIKTTRKMIQSVIEGSIHKSNFETFPVFGFQIPLMIPGIEANILNPKLAWSDPVKYDTQIHDLAKQFSENFKKFEKGLSPSIIAAGPSI
jgi:phosphoenolpyruvate carboxykinase (ATP)